MKVPGHYYVYIVECSDNSYYTGFTNDVDLRVIQHNDGIDPKCYTFKRRPVHLVYHELYHNVDVAIAREKQIKRWSRAKKAALIAGDLTALKIHAKSPARKRGGLGADEGQA